MLETLRRYRSLVVIMAIVAAIVFIPQRDTQVASTGSVGQQEQAVSGQAIDTGTAVADAGDAARAAAPGSATNAQSTGGAPGTGGAAGGGPGAGTQSAAAAQAPDGSVVVDGVAYPGMGSQQALDNPNCDPAQKRVKWPHFSAAPCVAKWPAGADNLGATSTGVTKDKITFVVPVAPQSDTESEDDYKARKHLIKETFYPYAQHNELWGRRIDLKFFETSGADEVAQRADAIEIYNRFKPFMVVDSIIGARPMVIRAAELAARGVVTWNHQPPWKDSQAFAPRSWGVGHDERLFAEHIAEFAAKSLQGRNARWAGDASMTVQPRKFGLVYPDTWDIAFFNQAKSEFDLEVATQVEYKTGNLTSYQEQVRTQMAKLAAAGVNNVLAGAELFYMVFATREATAQGYFPEWTLTGWGVSDVSLAGRLYDPPQTQHMFGIGPVPVLFTNNADQGGNRIFQWEFQRPPSAPATVGAFYLLLGQIMRGLQGAGPNLNPTTFKNALFATPPAGGAWCNCSTSTGESFGRWIKKPWDDYSGWDDMTLKWWKADEPCTDEIGVRASGCFVMVNQGQRYLPRAYPTDEPKFFDPNDAAHHMTFDQLPPGDRWTSYEHSDAMHTNYCGKSVDECFPDSMTG